MPKQTVSPQKFTETVATSQKARFFYNGAFQMAKRKEQLSNPKPTRASPAKPSFKK